MSRWGPFLADGYGDLVDAGAAHALRRIRGRQLGDAADCAHHAAGVDALRVAVAPLSALLQLHRS